MLELMPSSRSMSSSAIAKDCLLFLFFLLFARVPARFFFFGASFEGPAGGPEETGRFGPGFVAAMVGQVDIVQCGCKDGSCFRQSAVRPTCHDT